MSDVAIVPQPLNVPPPHSLAVGRDPELVIDEARKVAKAVRAIIDAKPTKVMLNGELYPEFEDWMTIARFYGVTVRVRTTRTVSFGSVRGFEASAEALLVEKDLVISRAEAMCLNDEAWWSMRPKYEYQNGQRKKVGMEPVPLFQLRSMAQTRACAKALRQVFAWVMVLAGVKPTPAEEMQREENNGAPAPQPQQGSPYSRPPRRPPQKGGQGRGSSYSDWCA